MDGEQTEYRINPMIRYLPCTIAVFAITACDSSERREVGQSDPKPRIASLPSLFESDEHWEATFGSRDGSNFGMDSDSTLRFGADGRVELIEAGVSVRRYHGIHRTDEAGVIHCEFARYHAEWPPMILRKSGEKISLHRADGSTAISIGDRGASFESSEMKPFWPFALIDRRLSQPEEPTETCLCCNYVSLPFIGGAPNVCKVCFWENNPAESIDPDRPDPMNGDLTLKQARENFSETGVSDPTLKKFVLSPDDRSKLRIADGKPK